MLTPDQVDDFVTLTQNVEKRYKWTDLALKYQRYVSSQIIQKSVQEDGGPHISFRVKVRNTGTARATGLFAQDVTKVEDVMVTATVPWRMQTCNYSYSIYEDLFQSDRETIIRVLKIREHDALSDMAELGEEFLWSAPSDPTDQRAFGIPFWIQKDPTTTPEGDFNGGDPSGFASGAGNISVADYPRHRNWTFGYENVTTDDLVRKMKKAIAFTEFEAPVPYPELGYGSPDYMIYTTYRVQEPLERLAETRNENLGRDVARFLNMVTVGGIPIRWVPFLQYNDTSDPVYGINWQKFRPYVKRGLQMRRSPPKESPAQHDTRTVHIDNAMNYCCLERRRQWVGSLAAS